MWCKRLAHCVCIRLQVHKKDVRDWSSADIDIRLLATSVDRVKTFRSRRAVSTTLKWSPPHHRHHHQHHHYRHHHHHSSANQNMTNAYINYNRFNKPKNQSVTTQFIHSFIQLDVQSHINCFSLCWLRHSAGSFITVLWSTIHHTRIYKVLVWLFFQSNSPQLNLVVRNSI